MSTTTAAAAARVAAALDANGGRKFTAADVTPDLRDAALKYLAAYTGSFNFLLDLRSKAGRKPLTDGQVKGVLNCVRADINRAKPGLKPWQRQVAQTTDHAVKGSYTIGDVTVRVVPSRKFTGSFTVKVHVDTATYKAAGWDYAGYVSADGVWNVAKSFSDSLTAPNFLNSIEVVLHRVFSGDDLTPNRVAFSAKSDRCSHCHHGLDDDASYARGLGPDCAAKLRKAAAAKAAATTAGAGSDGTPPAPSPAPATPTPAPRADHCDCAVVAPENFYADGEAPGGFACGHYSSSERDSFALVSQEAAKPAPVQTALDLDAPAPRARTLTPWRNT